MGQIIGATKKRIVLITIPFLFALGIAVLFYPGFMSYDTIHAIHGARDGVTDSMWPPMVSYVWRVVDLASLNPSAMHFSQIFLLLFSSFFVIYFFTKKIKYATAFLLIYLSIPVVLGTIAVIWKDVLMAAFFLAGFAVTIFMSRRTNKSEIYTLSVLATCLIFLGVCSRHNGIIGAVPLFFYVALVICSKSCKPIFGLWGSVIILGITLTGGSFIVKSQLDNYSLPHFVKLDNNTEVFLRTVRVLDIAGASLCSNVNYFSEVAPNLSLEEIKNEYDPRHINLSQHLFDKIALDQKIDALWLDIALHHPICFFSNKFHLAEYLVGANKGDQFLITNPAIDTNEYGYVLSKSSIRDSAVSYIIKASHLFFLRPWFLYLVSIISFIYMALKRELTAGNVSIFLSAIFYMGSLVIFGNAADARLPFYTTSGLLISLFITWLGIRGQHK